MTTCWYSTQVGLARVCCFSGRSLPSNSTYFFPEVEVNDKNIKPEGEYEEWNLKYNDYYCTTSLTWVDLKKCLRIFFSVDEQSSICYNKHCFHGAFEAQVHFVYLSNITHVFYVLSIWWHLHLQVPLTRRQVAWWAGLSLFWAIFLLLEPVFKMIL